MTMQAAQLTTVNAFSRGQLKVMDTWDMFVKQPFASLKVTEVSRCWNKNKHVGLEIVMFDVCFLWDNLI